MSRVLHVIRPIRINRIGVSTLVKITKWAGFAISLFVTAGHITVAWDIPSTMSMYNYFKNLEPAISVEKVPFDQFAMGLFLLSNICELICFFVLFYHMRKHHRRHVRLCLPNKPKVAAKKAKRNVITATGHFVSWIAEILVLGIFPILVTQIMEKGGLGMWIFFTLIPSINLIIFPTIQGLMFKELRAHIFHLGCEKFKSDCIVGKAEGVTEKAPPPPFVIEMQQMPICQYATIVHIRECRKSIRKQTRAPKSLSISSPLRFIDSVISHNANEPYFMS